MTYRSAVLAAAAVLALLSIPASAASHKKGFDPDSNATTPQLLQYCDRHADKCSDLVWKAIVPEYWGCLPQNVGVDENTATKMTYDWLRANKAQSTGWWMTDAYAAFYVLWPSCPDYSKH